MTITPIKGGLATASLILMLLTAAASAEETNPTLTANTESISADLSSYSEITVRNLSDGTEKRMLPTYIKKRFPEELAKNLTASGAFNKVSRRSKAKSGVIVDGRVLKYTQATQRVAGVASSQFKIRVKLIDAASGDVLDTFVINRDSHNTIGAKFKSNQERVETYIDNVLHTLTVGLITARLGAAESMSKSP